MQDTILTPASQRLLEVMDEGCKHEQFRLSDYVLELKGDKEYQDEILRSLRCSYLNGILLGMAVKKEMRPTVSEHLRELVSSLELEENDE